jgi:hypothetical protein
MGTIRTKVCDGIVDRPRLCVQDVVLVAQVVIEGPGPASPALYAITIIPHATLLIIAEIPKMRALRQGRLGLALLRHLRERRAHEQRRKRSVQPGRGL